MTDIRDANVALQRAIVNRVVAGNADVRKTLRAMIEYVPEISFPGKPLAGDTVDEINQCPFFTETYLYNLMGKEDARTILAYLGQLARALGYDGLWEMQEEVFKDDDA